MEREGAFSDSDVRLLSTLAASLSVALDNARLFDETTHLLAETEQRNAELAVINEIGEALAKQPTSRRSSMPSASASGRYSAS